MSDPDRRDDLERNDDGTSGQSDSSPSNSSDSSFSVLSIRRFVAGVVGNRRESSSGDERDTENRYESSSGDETATTDCETIPSEEVIVEAAGTGSEGNVGAAGTVSEVSVETEGTGSQVSVETEWTGSQVSVETDGTGSQVSVETVWTGSEEAVPSSPQIPDCVQIAKTTSVSTLPTVLIGDDVEGPIPPDRRNAARLFVAFAIGAMMITIVVLASLLATSLHGSPSDLPAPTTPPSPSPAPLSFNPTATDDPTMPPITSPRPPPVPTSNAPVSSSPPPTTPFRSLKPSPLPKSAPIGLRPTGTPSTLPSAQPSPIPTSSPSVNPTLTPSSPPSQKPTELPATAAPSRFPSQPPTEKPSSHPTGTPSALPSVQPSPSPTSSPPSVNPTLTPSSPPSQKPTSPPSTAPSPLPSQTPTNRPSTNPTIAPSFQPTNSPLSPAPVVPPSSPPIEPQMVQLGNDIDGDAAEDETGSSVALSSDGTVLAVGAWNNSDRGRVKVYAFSRGTWVQVGGNLDGEDNDSRFGRSVALSADGTVLAVGAEQHDKNSAEFYVGRAEIFVWNGGSWVRRGLPIDGKGADDYFGAAIDLSNDGTVLVVGANSYQSPGSVSIYEWINAGWQQRGVDLEGTSPNDSFGYAVSISSDGSVVAIGARANDNDNGSDAGQVRLFHWNGASWDQRGAAINGEGRDEYFGNSVALSGDGNTVAIGASLGNYCKVFRFDEDWTQLGQTIPGEEFLDRFGSSVSLSSSGERLIVGAIWHGSSGSVFVYDLSPDRPRWVKVGEQVGESPDDDSGASVATSRDGLTVAIGAPRNDGVNGEDSGQVRVFRIVQ